VLVIIIKILGILALPSVQFYAGPLGLVENFPCGPSKVPILKRKLADIVNAYVDPKTLEIQFKVEFDYLLSKARLQTFDAGNVIMRQGMEGNMFYVIESDIPTSSVLSGKKEPTLERLRILDDKYGVHVTPHFDGIMSSQIKTISVANQKRGSVNSPRPIIGVDVEDEGEDMVGTRKVSAARCFEHIMRTQPVHGT